MDDEFVAGRRWIFSYTLIYLRRSYDYFPPIWTDTGFEEERRYCPRCFSDYDLDLRRNKSGCMMKLVTYHRLGQCHGIDHVWLRLNYYPAGKADPSQYHLGPDSEHERDVNIPGEVWRKGLPGARLNGEWGGHARRKWYQSNAEFEDPSEMQTPTEAFSFCYQLCRRTIPRAS